jgi:hypothetical protein
MTAAKPIEFGPPDWLPLNAAFMQVLAGYGSRELAAGELYQALLDGRLKSGAIQFPPLPAGQHVGGILTANKQHHLLKPEFWRQFEGLIGADDGSVRCWPPGKLQGRWYFFVRRSDLDALGADHPVRRRPGPKPKHDWNRIEGEIRRRCIDPKTRRTKVPGNERKFAEDILDWCETAELEHGAPAESAIREAVKKVCAALR